MVGCPHIFKEPFEVQNWIFVRNGSSFGVSSEAGLGVCM